MTDVERAEKWLGVSASELVEAVAQRIATHHFHEAMGTARLVECAVTSTLVELWKRRVRTYPQQRYVEKVRRTP